MGWVRLDDDMLDHPKWRRALRDGGEHTIGIWLRLTSWCSRRLTDGEVPADMVDEVAELGRTRSDVRRRALEALVNAGLLAWAEPGECTLDVRRGRVECRPRARATSDLLVICAYLQRNPSRASVEADRERRAQHMKRRRLSGDVTSHAPSMTTERDVVPARPGPARPGETPLIGSPPTSDASDRHPSPPEGLQPAANGLLHVHFPVGWRWSAETEAAAAMQGVDAAALAEHVEYWTTHVWRIAVHDLEGELRRSIPDIRKRRENRAAVASATGRRYGSAQPNAGKTGWEHLDEGKP